MHTRYSLSTMAFTGGSYVIVQKYQHNMKAWNALSTEAQEHIIGHKKLSDIELSDAEKPTSAHNALTVIKENGKEVEILRDNMPFGRPGYGEFGTYFIGYSRTPRITETILHNMFVGNPPGNYDRLLDFSTAVTGLIGERFEIWSKLGSGTEIELKIPAASAYAKAFASHRSFFSPTWRS